MPSQTSHVLNTRFVFSILSSSLLARRPPISPLFPYTTLFRSQSMDPQARPEELRLLEALLFASSEPLDQAALAKRRSEEHTSELQSRFDLVCRLLLDKKTHHRRSRMLGAQVKVQITNHKIQMR